MPRQVPSGGDPKRMRMWIEELDVEPDGIEYEMDTARLETRDLASFVEACRGTVDAARALGHPVAPFGCFCDDHCEQIGDCCADRDDVCQ